MAITRSQQARQMLKTAGAVEQDGSLNFIKDSESVTVPKEFKARSNAPKVKLAYITDAEAKMLKKKKPGTPHKGPKGIPSYDSFDAEGNFTSGAAMSAAETGDRSDTGRADVRASNIGAPRGAGPGVRSNQEQELRASAIAAGAGQRVNPGFFDSRNRISPQELALARAFSRDPNNLFARQAMRRTRGGGIMNFITSGGLLGNLIRGLGQRFGLGKRFDQPTYDMRGLNTRVYEAIPGASTNPNNLDIYNEFVDDEDDTNMITPKRKPEISPESIFVPSKNPVGGLDQLAREVELLEATRPGTTTIDTLPGSLRDFYVNKQGLSPTTKVDIVPDDINFTPFQKDVIEGTQDQSNDPFLQGAMADALTTPTEGKFGVSLNDYLKLKNTGYSDRQIQELQLNPRINIKDVIRDIEGPIFAADGGMIGGGIMDAAGRQQYFLGKLVKKATRAVKKIVKSPIGKLGIGAALAFTPFARETILPALYSKGKLTGLGKLAVGAGISSLPLLFGQEEEEQPTGFTGSVGGQIDPRAFTDPYGVLYGAFKAEGGSMKDEPVAKRTMPLLDMGGQEMDLRAEGGFVPIGRMEKADDVPARLSKNEFVFTADAVRNAGDGDVDKGAEVMYNMMKNLEAGGDVSQESQGLEGARNMFQTAKRLEDVV